MHSLPSTFAFTPLRRYGDYSPPDVITRALAIIMMICILFNVSWEISYISDLLQSARENKIGTPPPAWSHFVLIIGPLTPQQLRFFVHQFYHKNEDLINEDVRVVLISPLPPSVYTDVIRAEW